MAALIPFYPEGVATNVTPWPVVWLARNDYEGNAAGINHVLEKFPDAEAYHRFVVSAEKSREILLDPCTKTYCSTNRGNDFRKYPYPIEVKHLRESRVYKNKRRLASGNFGTYLSMIKHREQCCPEPHHQVLDEGRAQQ